MFLPTKSYNEFIDKKLKEPSIRIGRHVPANAVNMAYYFNPTATDAEKVLCADAPRNTIDHRVEELYRYLYDMPEANDNLFPLTEIWSDEEGYTGSLTRTWVRWHEKNHISEKNQQTTKTVVVDNKSDVPTAVSYNDEDEYTGTLYLDTTSYEVKTVTTELINTTLVMDIKGHELRKDDIVDSQLNYYMRNPILEGSSPWPDKLYVKSNGIYDSNGIFYGVNPYDGYTSPEDNPLVFKNIEKDPMAPNPDQEGTPSYKENCSYIALYAENKTSNPFTKVTYSTDAELDTFCNLVEKYISNGKRTTMYSYLMQWKNDDAAAREKYSITINRAAIEYIDNNGKKNYLAGYTMVYEHKDSSPATHNWSVYANYCGILTKPYEELRTYPNTWEATCHYTGIIRKVYQTYDGVAYYKGSVVKSEGIGNVNPDLNPELLMYPDDNGFLRTIDVNGNSYYKVEAEQFYITNVFKDNVACFYEYKLQHPIHDYCGPDDNLFYNGNAVKVYTSNLKNIPDSYKYQLKLKPAEYETVTEVIEGKETTIEKVKKYDAYLYTSFVSKTTDTYKASYNAFVDFNSDAMVNTNNGINEDIYNKPFMLNGKDFKVLPVNKATRTNKIKIMNPDIINDDRRYITFYYRINIYKKVLGNTNNSEKKFSSFVRHAAILNKEYAVESEYNNFVGRSMIISPKEYQRYLSPYDIIMKDQTSNPSGPVMTSETAKDYIFSCEIIESTLNSEFVGAINITCNPDGSGLLTAETTLDTGFLNPSSGLHTKKLIINNPYIVQNKKIYSGYMVKCLDVRNISVKAPREEHLLESWYPLIQFGHYSQVMDQYGTHTKVCYSMPEYDSQHWGKYGKPYVDINREQAEILNPHMIKVRNCPLYLKDNVNDTITIIRKKEDEEYPITIANVSFSEGIVITEEAISENDIILVSYSYLEEFYVYRGFTRNELDFCRIDLNPNQYHTYSDLDTNPSELLPTKNLFNKTIYFFLRPTIRYQIDGDNDDLINTDEEKDRILLQNKDTLYHTIDKFEPESDMDIYIGSVYIRQNTSLHSTILVDTRTRGGGVIEEMKDSLRRELEPESDFYLDIGCYDGKPYQENAVIIVRLDNSILKEYGGRFTQTDIEEKVKKWLGLGVYPIIEYVDSYDKYDMPQYNLIVEDSYTNVIDETPELFLECILD